MKGFSLAYGLIFGLLYGLGGWMDAIQNIGQTLPTSYEMVYHPAQLRGSEIMEELPNMYLKTLGSFPRGGYCRCKGLPPRELQLSAL